MATLLMRPADGGNADKKRRARKGKNAQKKQPQRGLGVAQLEKLRLQEQSLLCATPPTYSLRLSTDVDHPLARCSNDVSQTVLSLTSCNVHAQAGASCPGSSVLRVGEAGTLSRLSSLNGHSTTQSCMSPTPLGHDMNKAIASRAMACLSQSSNKFASVNASHFSNVLTATQLQILESQAQAQQKVEERRAAEQAGNTTAYIFPSISNYLKEAPENCMNDEGFKLHSAFNNHVGATTNIVRTNSTKELSSFQSYPSQLQAWPAAEKVTGRKRPWLALQENGGQGCYAQALDLNAPVEESDAGENELGPIRPNQAAEFRVGAHYTTGVVRNALGNSSLPLGWKLSSSTSHWKKNESPSPVTAYFPEMGLYSENAMAFKQCSSQSSIKDSCSSATGGSSTYFSRNRQTPLRNPEIPSSFVEKESICGNFLTLGISNSSYPDRTGWNEPEESIQDNTTTSVNDISRLRLQGTTTSGCEGDNHATQVRKSAGMQIAEGVDLKGGPSRSLSWEFNDGGDPKRKSSMLVHDSLLTSSSPYSLSLLPPHIATNNPGHVDQNTVHYDPSVKSAGIVEDILDLNLKLAL